MPGFPDCALCEFKDDPARTCWCVEANLPTICTYLRGDRGDDETREAYRNLVHERTTGEASPVSIRVPEPIYQVDPRPDVIALERKRQAATGVLRAALANDCPHRGEKIGSGCNCQYRCGMGYGWFEPGVVSMEGCLQCVQGHPPRPTGA